MSFELSAASGLIASTEGPLLRRPESALTFLGNAAPDTDVLLDTTWYIDRLRGSLSVELSALADRAAVHSAIAIAEMTHAIGRLSPSDPRSQANATAISAYLKGLPSSTSKAPSATTIGEAGLLAGVAARRMQIGQEWHQALLNDAILYLQAMEMGLSLVTRNIADFDRLNQLVPDGRVLFYRQHK